MGFPPDVLEMVQISNLAMPLAYSSLEHFHPDWNRRGIAVIARSEATKQ